MGYSLLDKKIAQCPLPKQFLVPFNAVETINLIENDVMSDQKA